MRKVLVWLTAMILLGCQPEKKEQLLVNDTIFNAAAVEAQFETKELEETSGITESFSNPGLLWVHNDSGDKARIFLIDTLANIHTIVWLDKIENRDWEAIASGPGPEEGKKYLYVGDIGDNDAKHKYKFIYRIEEPTIRSNVHDTTITKVDCIKFQLPDGQRDSEAMMLDPLTRDIYILSKREQKVNLYRLPYPQSTTEAVTAELVLAKLEFNQYQNRTISKNGKETLINGYHAAYYNQVVSSDISNDGNEILIKSYSAIYYWKREPNETIVNAIKRKPTLLPYAPEPQGEAVSFNLNRTGYFTINEQLGKMPQQLLFYRRK